MNRILKELRILKLRIQYYDLKYPYAKLIILVALLLFLFKGSNTISKLLAFYIAVVCHEISHGLVALLFGDDTAKKEKRLSLNPLNHISLYELILPVFLLIINSPILIMGAKPVPVNYNKLKRTRLATFLISISGIFTNFLIAFIFYPLIFKVNNSYILEFLINLISINIALGVFNILPIPPLDGSRVVRLFAPRSIKDIFDIIEYKGLFLPIMFILFNIPSFNQFFYYLISLPYHFYAIFWQWIVI